MTLSLFLAVFRRRNSYFGFDSFQQHVHISHVGIVMW